MKLWLFFALTISLIFPSTLQAAQKAQEIPAGLEWLNVKAPLTLEGLRGKYVLLDFWTFCCINCQHIIPDLKKLEEKYPNELVVIGVHSAKFDAESITQNIREAILRHDIRHPVVNDPDLSMWNAYNVNAWPTVTLISPSGEILLQKAGEGVFDPVDAAIQKSLPSFKGQLNPAPILLSLEKDNQPKTFLKFPGKIIGFEKGLFISDSGNSCVLKTDFEGKVLEIIGEGKLKIPQGLAYANNYLYITDIESHAIYRFDLINKTFSVLADGLRSPWDITIHENTLFIAMAGSHQIWALDFIKGKMRLHAGNGHENIADGPLLQSSLAQPSGITTDGNKLYFADSEVSALRMADIDPNGEVTTLAGHGLFVFGDVDGSYQQARLKHPLGVTHLDGTVYLTDTYNDKIKMTNPQTKETRTLAQGFNEPGGLAFANGRFFIADTNNHRIAVMDKDGTNISTLPVGEHKQKKLDLTKFKGTKRSEKTSGPIKSIALNITLPNDHELVKPSQSFIRIYDKNLNLIQKNKIDSLNSRLALEAPLQSKSYIEFSIYYCRKGEGGICLIKNAIVEVEASDGDESVLIIEEKL